jgi:predicted XRE-type DNA-binding protein
MVNGRNRETITRGSGNVFADLGRDAGEKQTRVRLAVAITNIIQSRHLSQAGAARVLDINQPKVSALVNYQLDGFSVERLMHFLNAWTVRRNCDPQETTVTRDGKDRGQGRSAITRPRAKASDSSVRATLIPAEPLLSIA